MRHLLALCLALLPLQAAAAVSDPARGMAASAVLMTAEDGVGAGVSRLSAGLAVTLDEGWKTYWRSPGEVGLPPALDWSGSRNVASVEMAYPAPERFVAFEIENYGYADAVTFPLTVALERPGEAASLRLKADLLVCEAICVPETVEVALDLPEGGGMDVGSAAHLAEWVARVPVRVSPGGTGAGLALTRAHWDAAAVTLTATSARPFRDPAVFPENGWGSFGAPDLRVSGDGRTLWARLPVLAEGEGPMALTVVDGARAATFEAPRAATPPRAPADGGLWAALGLALLGGLILNLMPCVLPVLSLKLASALQMREAAPGRVRAGFLLSAAGVMGFFLLLAGAVIAARAGGLAVGWGVQFQSPVFLAVVAGLAALFAANLFGWFEVALPQGATTAMAGAEGRGGWRGDLATGAFAALMATPCSAPFLGAAVTYALTHGPGEIVAVFGAMGAGLALPFLVVAAAPGAIRLLPRPGRWMTGLKVGLGLLLLAAVAWLLLVLAGAGGAAMALVAGAAIAAMLGALAWRRRPAAVGAAGLAALVAAALLVPVSASRAGVEDGWVPFSEAALSQAVARGETVLVDVTADWCLTCLANKRVVLDPVAPGLGVVLMRADWTRPDPAISAYLAAQGRHGIPFNAVHGPGAPEGIVLPELLSADALRDAVAAAG